MIIDGQLHDHLQCETAKYRQRYDRYLVYGDETSDADNDTSQVDESDEAISPPLAMTDDSDFAPRDRSAILSPEGNDDITAARHGQSGTARHPSHQLPNLELSLQSSDPKYADSEISHIDFGQKLQRPIYGQLDASKESGPMHITRATPVISPNSAHGNKSRPETPVRHSQRSAVKNGHKHEDSKIVIDNQAVTRRH